jgi:prepilin-type N-terminal cleavage/methylation domain-containing protein
VILSGHQEGESEVMSNKQVSHSPRGLTLIELVLVVAVLAILAGFIVPRLGFIRNLAGEAANATIIADSANQAVLFNTAIGHYPQGEDTLLDSTGALYGSLNSSLKNALTALDLSTDTNAAKSLNGQLGGGTVVLYANDTTNSVPANSGTIVSNLTSSTGKVAQVKVPTTLNDASYPIYLAAYGATRLNTTTGAPNDGTYLVALGYGPGSEINGKTGLEAPLLFDKTAGEYNRPILLLKVFGNNSTALNVPPGTNAATSISIGFDASTANSQLAKYTIDQQR